MSVGNLISFNKRKKLELVLQTEVAECGLACIAMIASYHGCKVNLNILRSTFTTTLKGETVKGLIRIADKLSLMARAIKLDINEIDKLSTPCILHWNLNHFVVLESVTKKGAVIFDPASGKKKVSVQELSRSFTGVALELTPSKKFVKEDRVVKTRLSDLWSSIKGLKSALYKILFFSVVLQLVSLVSPLYMQLVIDEVLINQDFQLLNILALAFGLFILIKVALLIIRGLLVLYLGSQLSAEIASNLFRHLLRLPMKYYESRHIGDVISRFGSIDYIKQLLTTGVVEVIVDGFLAIGLIVMMYLYSPLLSNVVVLVSLIYLVIRLSLYNKFRQLNEELLVQDAKQESNFMESVRGIQSVKLFGKEPERHSVWQNYFVETINSGIRLGKFNITFSSIKNIIFGLENIIVVYIAATQVMSSLLTIGMLYAYMSFKSQFTDKISNLVDKLIQFKMLSLHLERLGDITQAEEEKNLDSDFFIVDSSVTSLVLNDIHYKYGNNEPSILKGISAEFREGESVAIVGESGSGKTTLMKVMLGLLQPVKGSVLSFGSDISKLGLREYRKRIGTVMQDDQLFTGSIADNISFFETDLNDEKVQHCAKLAFIHEDIMKMPMGYYTLIGDMGSTLSGGQKQRLLLARALYTNPKILFLDEATSHLDIGLERVVNDTVKSLNITRIIVAHRPETIAMADRVLVLEGGMLHEIKK